MYTTSSGPSVPTLVRTDGPEDVVYILWSNAEAEFVHHYLACDGHLPSRLKATCSEACLYLSFPSREHCKSTVRSRAAFLQ